MPMAPRPIRETSRSRSLMYRISPSSDHGDIRSLTLARADRSCRSKPERRERPASSSFTSPGALRCGRAGSSGVMTGPPSGPHSRCPAGETGGMASQSVHSEGAELGRYLRARRTQTSPAHVGLTVGAGIRRTPGLRREELATLAGISIDYYVRLERGKETRPSPAVLDSLARALHMDDQEHQHLRELAARAARYAAEPPPAPSRTVRPHLKLLLESLRPNPAYVISRSMDMLAWNPGGLALYAGLEDWPVKHRNLARSLFLHPAARDLFPDWDRQVTGCVAR